MVKKIIRALVEVGFIVFLFYSNLLMGAYARSGIGFEKGLWWALQDIFTIENFMIAAVAGCIGYLVFEFLRRKSK